MPTRIQDRVKRGAGGRVEPPEVTGSLLRQGLGLLFNLPRLGPGRSCPSRPSLVIMLLWREHVIMRRPYSRTSSCHSPPPTSLRHRPNFAPHRPPSPGTAMTTPPAPAYPAPRENLTQTSAPYDQRSLIARRIARSWVSRPSDVLLCPEWNSRQQTRNRDLTTPTH